MLVWLLIALDNERHSMTALEGITLFAFHGKLNEDFDGREAGRWSQDVLKIRNGRFTFRDRDTTLKVKPRRR